MSDATQYLLVVLSILSIMLTMDIRERYLEKEGLVIQVAVLIIMIMIMFKVG